MKKIRNEKRSGVKGVLLKSLVAITLFSAMMVSTFLGTSNAEYFKTLKKKLDLEMTPDLNLSYYLYDADAHDGSACSEETGVYKDAENILQKIVVGTADPKPVQNRIGNTVYNITGYFGDSVVYQIKIPVSEPGYYTLDFTVDFLIGTTQEPYQEDLVTGHANTNATGGTADKYVHPNNAYYDDNFFTMSHEYCMGCEVLNIDDGYTFGVNKRLDMSARISATDTNRVSYATEPIYYADSAIDSVYQWKTLTPSRAENVKLAFKVTENDVQENGYVIWAWDFTGIKGNHNYRLSITGLEVEKTMEIDGTTKYRTNNDPYFMFPQTSFTNDSTHPGGSAHGGRAFYSPGRGTFVTEATANSLGMRSEVLLKHNGTDFSPETPNPVSIQVPLKNVKYDTTYKVTFDFSVARQGNQEPLNSILYNSGFSTLFGNVATEKLNTTNFYDYTNFSDIFVNTASDTQFRAYLYSTNDLSTIGRTANDHKANRTQITYADKAYNSSSTFDHSLVRYNEVTRLNSAQSSQGFPKFPNYTTVDVNGSVNDTFSTIVQSGKYGSVTVDATHCRNWFNAVQHVEQNGQQGINWITFYNTTFAFNIPEADNGNVDLDNLYWIWQIEALDYYGWYNIRIDNVRIEEVVQYSSELDNNGVKIANTQIGIAHMSYRGQNVSTIDPDTGVFNNFRGWNGTGQNCNPRGFDRNNYFSAGNIYAPIIDARRLPAAPGGGTGATDYKIYLDGRTVCKGGIYKYVYSADGGNTWHDMTFEGNDEADLARAEHGIEQNTQSQTLDAGGTSNFVEFKRSDGDATNSNYDGFKLVADLSPYKNQSDLDIIIAAVPGKNQNLRCEILRIINYHPANMYVSKLEKISSDIKATDKNGAEVELSKTTNDFSITSLTSGNSDYWPFHYYPVSDRGVFAHNTTRSKSIRYDEIKTTYSDIPVKTTLTVSGSILCWGGVYEYAFSVDDGKTWNTISRTQNYDITNYSTANDIANGDLSPAPSVYEKLLFKWLTRSAGNDQYYFPKRNGLFNTSASALKVDLSAYEGQVVDVIVAAKPNAAYNDGTKADIYLPVAKIDNVAVYGENGMFFTRLHRVILDQNDIYITPDATHASDKSNLNFTDKWKNLGFNAYAYTIFEPQNVNALNSRFYNDKVNVMQSGGRVTIDGYVVCKGGVRRYKYSLDGGKTWTVINDSGANITNDTSCTNNATDTMLSEARKSDNSFVVDDGKKGDYCCYYNYKNSGSNLNPYGATSKQFYEHALEFNLPALPDGAVRNLLVVAESNKDKLIPVLHMKIQCVHENGISQYGYQSSTNRGELSTLSAGWQSELNQSLIFALSGNSMNRITIPVTQSGEHQLVFTHMLNGSNITNGSKAEFFVVHDDGDYTYFSDVSRQLNSNAENVEHVYSVNCPDNGGLNRITANITVTDDDVKRGYIVLDANYTGITADSITVNLQLARDALTEKPSQTLIDTFFATKDQGYGNNVLMSTATEAGNHSFSYDPILNPPIRKGGINYDGSNKFPNASLSVPKTYFEVGEPITVDYNATGLTNYGRIYITSDQKCQPDRYGDLYIKCAEVNAGTTGIVKFTADAHNLDDSVYGNGNVPLWTNNIDGLNELRKLPAGEYKIWFVNNTTSFDPFNMQRNSPYQLVTEPISIKVIDPEAPDLSMTYWTDRTYTTLNDDVTAITLNKVVYEQGEEIPFRISGGYEHSWVTVVRSDDFKGYVCDGINVSDDKFASYEDKSYVYCRYAQWGAANDYLSGNGYLKTIDCGVYLEPGQYKVVYLFGQCLQHAWAANDFPVQQHRGQKQKIMAIIDITIVPKNTLQKYSASYVKNDGSVGNILLDDIEPAKLENLTHTVTTLNDSTFTVKTTPVRHNVTLNIPNDVDTSLKNNVAFNIQTLPGNYSFNKISDGKTDYNAPFYSANLGSGTAALKIPVNGMEAGTYDFSFGAYLNSPIAHRGYNKKITTTWHDPYEKEHKIPLNYDGAYMSVPKAVYTVGEVIPISYYSKGSVTAVSPIKETGNLPWIGLIEHTLTQEPADFENDDKTGNSPNGVWNKRSYVNANTEGVKYISTEGIPAGTYQIYFRDNSAKLTHDINSNVKDIYWWEYDMVHPITITIVESNNVANANSNVKYAFSNVKNAGNKYTSGTAELSQRVLYQGDNIEVDVKLSDNTQTYRLALCRADDTLNNFVVQKYLDKTIEEVTYTIKTSNFAYKSGSSEQGGAGNEKIPPGKYTLYLINSGSIVGAETTGRIYAVMDITILPAPTTVPVRGSAQIQSLSKQNNEIIEITQNLTPPTEIANPFNYYNVSGTFTVTQQDVERGYVIFEYNLTGLPTYSEFTLAIDNLTVTKRQGS